MHHSVPARHPGVLEASLQHHPPPCPSDLPQVCARCGAVLRLDSRAFAPVEHDDGLICPACDEAEMACAAEMQPPAALAAYRRAFDDTLAGSLA
jgi:hypothetical protein